MARGYAASSRPPLHLLLAPRSSVLGHWGAGTPPVELLSPSEQASWRRQEALGGLKELQTQFMQPWLCIPQVYSNSTTTD